MIYTFFEEIPRYLEFCPATIVRLAHTIVQDYIIMYLRLLITLLPIAVIFPLYLCKKELKKSAIFNSKLQTFESE